MKTETSESFLVAMKDRRDHADRAVTNGGAGETSTVLVSTAMGRVKSWVGRSRTLEKQS